VAEIRGSLPADLEVVVERLTPAAFPFLSVNLSGGLQPADLYDYAFYVMRPAISRVAGVGNVEVLASDTREIEVIADPARLTAAGLKIGDVADALKAANNLQPVGRYNAGGLQHLVLASGMWKSLEDIPATPLVVKGGTTIRVADVATVLRGSPDRTSLISGGGHPAANISISQQIGANILDVRAGVESALTELAKTLPAGLQISKTYDLAEFVATATAMRVTPAGSDGREEIRTMPGARKWTCTVNSRCNGSRVRAVRMAPDFVNWVVVSSAAWYQ